MPGVFLAWRILQDVSEGFTEILCQFERLLRRFVCLFLCGGARRILQDSGKDHWGLRMLQNSVWNPCYVITRILRSSPAPVWGRCSRRVRRETDTRRWSPPQFQESAPSIQQLLLRILLGGGRRGGRGWEGEDSWIPGRFFSDVDSFQRWLPCSPQNVMRKRKASFRLEFLEVTPASTGTQVVTSQTGW